MNNSTDVRGTSVEVPLIKIPRHVAIIMDGNGRWATSRGLPRAAGHQAGTENLRRVLRAAADFGVEIVTVYALSTENWSRPEAEIRILLGLLERFIDSEMDDLNRNGVQVRHIGRLAGVSPRLAHKIQQAVQDTQHNTRLILNVAFNYGGRAEIVDAMRRIVAEGIPPEEINEDTITQRLYTGGLPDPDLLIRTGGDMRVSNFMIWQVSYAEFYVTPTYWPDFDRDELHKALLAYQQRDRRFGRLNPETR